MRPRILSLGKSAIALIVCGVVAWTVALVAQGRSWRTFVPFAFLLVIWLVGLVGGRTVGILASVLTALIFAHELFSPLGSLAVQQHDARSSLSWMVLAGVTISYLLLPSMAEPGGRE